MTEELSFQEFGIRKNSPHVLDPLVAIQIEEAIVNNGKTLKVAGVLFGKQQTDNLVISGVLVTSIGELTANNEFRTPDNLETLLQYYEKVYSLKCVGLFAAKSGFDRESYAQFSSSFQFKTTTDFVFLTVNFDPETADFAYTAYSPLRNKYFKDLFVAINSVPLRIAVIEDEYAKSELTSHAGHIFRDHRQKRVHGGAGPGDGRPDQPAQRRRIAAKPQAFGENRQGFGQQGRGRQAGV